MYICTQEAEIIREANKKLIERYFNERPRNVEVLFNKTAVFMTPYFNDVVTLLNPELKEGETTQREKNGRLFKDIDLYDLKIWSTEDPNFFWTMNKGKGKIMRQDGKYYDYSNFYIHYFRFENGKIEEMAEYANPLRLMDGFGLEHPQLPTPDETNKLYEKLGLFKPM